MPKYAEEILAAATVSLEMKREHPSIALGTVYLPPMPGAGKDNLMEEKYHEH